ncbi:MAG: hypothetical protein EB150_03865 [Nitrososphaeria archaeon]|nr:hypothetical protein [Nitrosopumilaceae archaeon]NDB89009.1 hypothetical protein [Nitrososphaerota archaeon]NDF29332.1 hypothetical protein [Nitrososphaeria archaeon]NDB63661.1 hypothetical protein [Nitrosopumilaceae archaeon]NDB90701.1 hypothetical protein [Nitrososphaerota archaeon]
MMDSEKKFVAIGLIGGMIALGGIVLFAGQGYVRHVNIFWPEEVRQTLEFRNVNGNTVVVGTIGNSGTNPDLITRADFVYVLTVKNADTKPHLLYVDTVDVKTKVLGPGELDTITIKSKKEATFHYYDIADQKQLLGTIQIKKVTLAD